ncbi:16004_t:CDS:2, partial [Racocetra fulgida]
YRKHIKEEEIEEFIKAIIARLLEELINNQDIELKTSPEYVIGYLVEKLRNKDLRDEIKAFVGTNKVMKLTSPLQQQGKKKLILVYLFFLNGFLVEGGASKNFKKCLSWNLAGGSNGRYDGEISKIASFISKLDKKQTFCCRAVDDDYDYTNLNCTQETPNCPFISPVDDYEAT